MSVPSAPLSSNETMKVLSNLLLSPDVRDPNSSMAITLRNLSREEFGTLVNLAHSNHVIIRGLTIYREIMLAVHDQARAEWAAPPITSERARIVTGIGFLRRICDAFDQEGLDVTVMKSLDHWPDFGSDIDLYTNAPAQAVCALMQKRFDAQIAHRSWGDRLACKWNFNIPGLPDPVEVHSGRLGQTGEQLVLASRLPEHARKIEIEGESSSSVCFGSNHDLNLAAYVSAFLFPPLRHRRFGNAHLFRRPELRRVTLFRSSCGDLGRSGDIPRHCFGLRQKLWCCSSGSAELCKKICAFRGQYRVLSRQFPSCSNSASIGRPLSFTIRRPTTQGRIAKQRKAGIVAMARNCCRDWSQDYR